MDLELEGELDEEEEKEEEVEDICNLEIQGGPCFALEEAWGYNSTIGRLTSLCAHLILTATIMVNAASGASVSTTAAAAGTLIVSGPGGNASAGALPWRSRRSRISLVCIN